jgi:hypothetical protein
MAIKKGHIGVTISGTEYRFNIETNSYFEVDITDFAPRAVSGTPALSQLGLYLDVGQTGWRHGFGQETFADPAAYQYAGSYIDTRHEGIRLFTKEGASEVDVSFGQVLKYLAVEGFDTNGVRVPLDLVILSQDIYLKRPVAGSWITVNDGAGAYRDILYNGKYTFAARNSRMQKYYFAQPTAATTTTLTFADADFERDDMWNTGKAILFDGTSATETKTISDSTAAGVITVSSPFSAPTPDTTTWVCLVANAGVAANPPTKFNQLAIFGGFMWGYERNTNFLHFWSEADGNDAEGGGTVDPAVVPVGTGSPPIINMYPFQNQLWVAKHNGLWTVQDMDSNNLAYHALPYDTESQSLNFKAMTVFNGFLIYTMRNRIYKFKSGIQDITPPTFDEKHPGKMFGNFTYLTPRGPFLYCLGQSNAAYADETNETVTGFYSLLCYDGVGWHKLWTVPWTDVSAASLWLDPRQDKLRIAVTRTGGSDYLYPIQLQTFSELPTDSYTTSTYHNLYTSYYDFGMSRIPKSFASITLGGEFPTNTQVRVQYRIGDATAWSTLGSYTTDMQEISFPVGTTGKRIQFRVQLYTTTAANSPIVKRFIIKLMVRPQVLYGVTCDIIVADSPIDPRKHRTAMSGKDTRAALKAARDSVSPITFTDIYGVSASAYLSTLRFITVAYEDQEGVQTLARCTFVYV